MWVSRRTDYATRAVLALSLAEEALNLDQLAEATEAPRSVLGQVMWNGTDELAGLWRGGARYEPELPEEEAERLLSEWRVAVRRALLLR